MFHDRCGVACLAMTKVTARWPEDLTSSPGSRPDGCRSLFQPKTSRILASVRCGRSSTRSPSRCRNVLAASPGRVVSGAAICIVVGACAGPVLAEDPGPIGRLIRGGAASPLAEGALPPLPPPVRSLRLADAFSPSDDDISQEPERPAKPSPVEQNTDE